MRVLFLNCVDCVVIVEFNLNLPRGVGFVALFNCC
jgi:hypothetical protein